MNTEIVWKYKTRNHNCVIQDTVLKSFTLTKVNSLPALTCEAHEWSGQGLAEQDPYHFRYNIFNVKMI